MYLKKEMILFFSILPMCFGKKSFTVLLDTTSSMLEEIDIIKSSRDSFATLFNSTNVDNFILVPFNDPDIGPPLFSPSIDGLLTSLDRVNVSGGLECPEDSISGLQKALEVSGEESHVFVFTDAYAKDNSKLVDIHNLCRNTRSHVIIFLSGRCVLESREGDINVYYDIARLCSGVIFRLDPIDLRQAFNFIKEIVQTEWNDITTHDIFTNYREFTFSINDSTKMVMAAIYGDNPSIQVISRDGHNPRIEKVIDTRHSIVIKLKELPIGDYKISVRCRGITSLTLYKRKDFPFQYGFATRLPKSLKETTLRPIPGWNNYLVFVVPPNASIQLSFVELHNVNKNETSKYTLQKQNGFYVTSAFFGPNTSFRILVSGYDIANNQDITESTNIVETQKSVGTSQWIRPEVELIEPDNTLIEYGSTVTLACKVTAYPKPEISWKDQNGNIFSSEDEVLEIPNVHISYVTVDNLSNNITISCDAKTLEGGDSQSLDLFVHRDFSFVVKQIPRNETIEYGTQGRLYCEVEAYPEATVNWYHNDSLIDTFSSENIIVNIEENTLLIKNMSLEDAGEYKCVAKNDIETRTFPAIIEVTGIEAPTIDIENTELILKPGDWTEIECFTKGKPIPEVTWKFKYKDEDQFNTVPEGVYFENTKLKIASVRMEHAGTYRCEASNILGMEYQDLIVKIEYPPIIRNTDDIVTIKEGETVQLGCEVDAMPVARVRWEMYQDDIMIVFDNRHVTEDNYTHRFEALWKDSGIYHCIAENNLGRAERKITVNVLVPPYIETPRAKTITTRIGSSVSLQCNILFGNPVPTTKWEFVAVDASTTVLFRGNSTSNLHLTNISKGHEGSYICIADNEVGSDSIKIYLKVQ